MLEAKYYFVTSLGPSAISDVKLFDISEPLNIQISVDDIYENRTFSDFDPFGEECPIGQTKDITINILKNQFEKNLPLDGDLIFFDEKICRVKIVENKDDNLELTVVKYNSYTQ